jgi:RNA polymerase sigma-70 factor (ECF subfamily)
METTIELLARVKAGDQSALANLVERSVPPLRRWARGRLPQRGRSLPETADLVQKAVLRAMPRLQTFEARHPGALQAFLRQAVASEIVDEIRKTAAAAGSDSPDAPDPSPLETVIGREGVERYEAALARLAQSDREAIIARLELQQSYEEVAIALDKPDADAARSAVNRAIERLVRELAALRSQTGPLD